MSIAITTSARFLRDCLLAAVLGALCASGAHAAPAEANLQSIEKSLNAVGDRIQRLQDMNEVTILQHTYGYFVDKAQWRSLADLWTQNGTLEIGGRGVFLGKDRVFEYMLVGLGPIGPHDGLLIDHQQFQCLPSVAEDGLHASIRCIAFVMSSGGWGHNYYEDRFVKENGVWKFQKLHGPFNMYSGYKIGWLDNTVLNTYPEKFPPPPDLAPTVIYLTYPNYYIEPYDYPNPVTGKPMPPPSPRAGGVDFGR
ncbi:MAG TPA: nuclear transport factor 2 family protein [Steroidobacteraceae bacterium]|nr:nuclear transport factor 2 family protein [Steroidobacteraceae bacterium]